MGYSKKQQKLLDFIRSGRGEITKKEAVQILERHYYANAEKYVGEILTRMVSRGILCRVKRGVYKLKTYPSGVTPGDKYHISANQISLF